MGAVDFMTRAKGKTVRDAFNTAVDEAQYMYGHAGYTGSIAEKDGWVEVSDIPEVITPLHNAQDIANQMINNEDPRINDKWGPAGAIRVGDDEWLFFGWASC
jgi:hypothetical protein